MLTLQQAHLAVAQAELAIKHIFRLPGRLHVQAQLAGGLRLAHGRSQQQDHRHH